MSSASLAIAHRPHPDSARIAAISAAIALNLAVILVVSRPISTVLFPAQAPSGPVPIHIIEPPPVTKPPPDIVLKPVPHPPSLPQTHPRTAPVSPPVAPPSVEGNVVAPPVTVPTLAPPQPVQGTAVDAAPVEASLAYRTAPLQFPVQALRQRMHGSVILRVLVDESGKPLDVVVEHSSGYPLLDRSARAQVLASWLFQPALVNGKATRAWARVPVTFALREQ